MKMLIPPVLFLLCALLMIGLDIFFPVVILIVNPLKFLFGIILFVFGLSMTIIVRKQFDKIQTEIHTFKLPEKLVTDGLFKVSRNPIYLGFTISLIGIWIFLGTLSPFTSVFFFVLSTAFWYIPHEEKTLETIFGVAYKDYKSKVRRWF